MIGEQDLLRISVWQVENASVDVPVRPDGKISVPLIGDVEARGLTTEQLQQVLTKKLAKSVWIPRATRVAPGTTRRMVTA